jgi:hypothetical protein
MHDPLAVRTAASDAVHSGGWPMIDYTENLTRLMQDIVSRVPTLSFIDVNALLVFARFGRSEADGPFATCHCLSLPPSAPGYYFWRDRHTGRITRRSEWFITKSPTVTIGPHGMKYLISFTLPRFCDQSLGRSRKERFYRRSTDAWVAKLDTVVHELYHIDPEYNGIRKITRDDGSCSPHSHSPEFFAQVARMVSEYLDTKPDPAIYDFLKLDFNALETKHAGVGGISFRSFPSYPQRFIERLEVQPVCPDLDGVEMEPWRERRLRASYSEDDLHMRQFFRDTSRRVLQKRQVRAA